MGQEKLSCLALMNNNYCIDINPVEVIIATKHPQRIVGVTHYVIHEYWLFHLRYRDVIMIVIVIATSKCSYLVIYNSSGLSAHNASLPRCME